jgi:hypothetical protein
MCVLSLAQSGEIHDREDLQTACLNNPDGFGYAIHTGRHILRRRSMDAASIIDRYLEDRSAHPNGPALFHARIATSGKVDNSGCHPFFLPTSSKVAIGHNGILPLDMKKIGGWKSDTRYFVEDIVRDVRSLSPLDLVGIEKWMGSGNKLVILSADSSLPPYSILNEKAGHWDDGIWWSNYSYTWSDTWVSSSRGTVYPMRANYSWSNKDIVPSVLKHDDDEEDRYNLIQWDNEDCPWCDRPLSEAMLEDGQCGHCWADLLDEDHVDSAFCNCWQCSNEQREDFERFIADTDQESNF